MSTRHILRHIHFHGFVPFHRVSALQDLLVAQNLAHKASPNTKPAPIPTILTFTPNPVYTFGRRDQPTEFDPAFLETLREPIYPKETLAVRNLYKKYKKDTSTTWTKAEIVPTLRGGLTTFHGPGQLVIYPILDLKSPYIRNSPPGSEAICKYPGGLDVRSYISLLESTTISVLKDLSIQASLTPDPGVWIPPSPFAPKDSQPEKIAAVGVHLRRNITSYGTALNINPDLRWFERIVPCGLEGKGTTSVVKQNGLPLFSESLEDPFSKNTRHVSLALATAWVRHFTHLIWDQNPAKNIMYSNRPQDRRLPERIPERINELDSDVTDEVERTRRVVGGAPSNFEPGNDENPYFLQRLIQYIRIDGPVEKEGSMETLARALEENNIPNSKMDVDVNNNTVAVTSVSFKEDYKHYYKNLKEAPMDIVDGPRTTNPARRDIINPNSDTQEEIWFNNVDEDLRLPLIDTADRPRKSSLARRVRSLKSDTQERISFSEDDISLMSQLLANTVDNQTRAPIRRITSGKLDTQEITSLNNNYEDLRQALLRDIVDDDQRRATIRQVQTQDSDTPGRVAAKNMDQLFKNTMTGTVDNPQTTGTTKHVDSPNLKLEHQEKIAHKNKARKMKKALGKDTVDLSDKPLGLGQPRRVQSESLGLGLPRRVNITLESDANARPFEVAGVSRFISYPNNASNTSAEPEAPAESAPFTGVRRYDSTNPLSTPKHQKIGFGQVNYRNERLREAGNPVRLIHVKKELDGRAPHMLDTTPFEVGGEIGFETYPKKEPDTFEEPDAPLEGESWAEGSETTK
jgi:lipoate-protein ligase B